MTVKWECSQIKLTRHLEKFVWHVVNRAVVVDGHVWNQDIFMANTVATEENVKSLKFHCPYFKLLYQWELYPPALTCLT